MPSHCFCCDIQLHAQKNTEGPRERDLLGKTLLPAKKLLYCTSAYYQKRRQGGERDDKVSQGMTGEVLGTKGTAEGRETMERQIMKQGRDVKQ